MASNTPMNLTKSSQEGLIQLQKQYYTMLNTQWNIREIFRQIDLDYIRENDLTKDNVLSKTFNRAGDANKFQNITIPVILPAVESAVVYQSSVFLSSVPIFEVVSSPQYIDAARQLSAVIAENSVRGGWPRELQMFFRNGFKYNLCALEVTWGKKSTPVFETDPSFADGKQGKPKNIIWEGNCIRNMDMYNTIWDNRVFPVDIPEKGEFAGYTELMSRIAFKNFLAQLDDKIIANVEPALASGMITGGSTSSSLYGSYYVPYINPNAIIDPINRYNTNWLSYVGLDSPSRKMDYKNSYEVTTLYTRILPVDFNIKVPSASTPQVWKLIIVNQEVIIYAERQTNAHNLIPILFGQPLEDGLGYQTKSLASNVTPIQAVASSLMNSVIHARRRSATDRVLFDPSRIDQKNINSDNPSAKIPVKPAAYGKPISDSVYAFPFRDDQSSLIMQELGVVTKLGDVVSGQNPARQGQFVKGNKTQTEFSDVMNNSNGRDQTTSLLLESQIFTPMKEILKINTLQYQQPTSVYYAPAKNDVKIDPVVLRQATMSFKISDGLAPVSKLINSDGFSVALQVMGSSPQIGAAYNVQQLFSYLMKTQGAQIEDFEKSQEQVAYEQALNSWNSLAQLSISKGQPWTAPQPTPEQYGYLQGGKLQQQNPQPPNAISNMLQVIATSSAPINQNQSAQDATA